MPISQGKHLIGAKQPARLAGSVACRSFVISAPSSNETTVTVTASELSTEGFPIEPGANISISEGGGLEDLWVTGAVGDVLYWMAAA